MMNGWRGLFGDRYGIDNLNIALIVMALLLSLIGRFFPRVLLLPLVGILLILLVFYRALSRKIVLRQAENERFLSLWYGLRDWVRAPHWPRRGGGAVTGRGFQADAGKRCFKCPSCGQKCRVPKGKGTIAITCPRCGQDFIRKT